MASEVTLTKHTNERKNGLFVSAKHPTFGLLETVAHQSKLDEEPQAWKQQLKSREKNELRKLCVTNTLSPGTSMLHCRLQRLSQYQTSLIQLPTQHTLSQSVWWWGSITINSNTIVTKSAFSVRTVNWHSPVANPNSAAHDELVIKSATGASPKKHYK